MFLVRRLRKLRSCLNCCFHNKLDTELYVAAVKNLETDNFFLNDEHEIPESRVVIEKGVVWKYNKTGEQETLQTTGPLKYGVILMVSHQGRRHSL